MIDVLDKLRDAYRHCKESGHPEQQSMLLEFRRALLEALNKNLSLYTENAELHDRLDELEAEIKQLREQVIGPVPTVQPDIPRKLS